MTRCSLRRTLHTHVLLGAVLVLLAVAVTTAQVHGNHTMRSPRPSRQPPTLAPTPSPTPSATTEPPETSTVFEIFRYLGIVFLVGMSAIFSGLTLGLMALDKTGLDVIIGAGEAPGATEDEELNAQMAKQIMPVRESGNQLLTTLVLGNVAVNSLLSILMADLTSGFVGFVLSSTIIVICGEIVPQAVFSRHALLVGSTLVPLVQLLLTTFYIMAKPIAVMLDKALGADVGTIFTKRELQKLLEIHVKQQMLHPSEGHIVRGAMSYRQKNVSSIMVPTDKIFSLPISFLRSRHETILHVETVKQIYQTGFSRIPVYDKDQNDIIGVFLVKDLVMIDVKDGNVPLFDFVQVFAKAAHRVWVDATLGDVLKAFKGGNTHMALVYDVNNTGPGDPFYELKGLVTLEDIVEEILQDKIVNEDDLDEAKRERKLCADRMTMDYV